MLYENSQGTHYQYSYSPWGVRTYLTGDTINFCLPGEEPLIAPFYRTYTGHEDLWMFGLLNANARLYSPYLGRFISPDPLLNEDGRPLDFNPYIYARNNPYRYIDRNGEIWWWAIFAALGAGANVWQNWDNIHSFGDGFLFAVAGAASGALGGVVGPGAVGALGVGTTGFFAGAATGAISGFISNISQGMMNSGITGKPYQFDWKETLIQTGISALTAGVIGGFQAKAAGLTFWKGEIPIENLKSYGNIPEWNSPELDAMPYDGPQNNPLDSRDISNLTSKQIGDMGEDWTAEILRKSYGCEPYRQISTQIEGVTNRWDFNIQNHFFEVKSGVNPRFTFNQKINIPKMINGSPYMFKGWNATQIPNVKIGTTINGPRQVTIFRWKF